MLYKNITEKIIYCALKVHTTLGCGFLEKIYRSAMEIECKKNNLSIKIQHPALVLYNGKIIGTYYADMVVEDKVLIELKALKAFDTVHYSQIINYLKATELKVGLLLNFGSSSLQIKRMIL